jgi:hypothetical protein
VPTPHTAPAIGARAEERDADADAKTIEGDVDVVARIRGTDGTDERTRERCRREDDDADGESVVTWDVHRRHGDVDAGGNATRGDAK